MTDQPAPDQPARPGSGDPAPSGEQVPPTAPGPSAGPPDGSPAATPEAGRRSAPSGFEAAFEGESWDVRRRRRSSSSSDSSSASSSSSSRSGSGRGSRRSSSRRSGPTDRDGLPLSERDRRRRSRRARHTRSVVLHVVLGVLGLGLAWIVVTGLLAAWQLDAARSDLTSLRTQIASGDDGIDATADSLAAHAHHAAVLTRGPAWGLVAAIPYVGDPFDAVRGITTQTSALVDAAGPGLVAAAGDINPKTVVSGGTVDLGAVQRAAEPVHTAAVAAARASDLVGALPTSTWLPFVDGATDDVASQFADLEGTLRTTDQTLQVLPTMLGSDGRTRKYFLAFQNNAELRGTGGLPGAFAIVTAQNGRIAIERFESDSRLGGLIPSGLDFGKDFNRQYAGGGPTPAASGPTAYNQYVDSNQSPNFPYAAQIWCAMWKNATGEDLDGALTVDPGALSYLLKATGSARAPDGVVVTADNVVELLQKDVYAKFPAAGENDDRKNYILGIAKAVETKIVGGARNSRALLQGLARSVEERRIVAWSADPTVQDVLGTTTIGGTVADTDQPYSLLALNNGAAGKLDYYLGRKVTVVRTGCGDTRQVTVTIALTNNAPASGLPPYVTERIGDIAPPPGLVPGQNRTIVNYVATKGASLLSATLDGQAAGAGLFDEVGHPSFQTILEIKPGQTRTWVLTLSEPAGDQPVQVVKQPGVTPIEVDVEDRSCS